MQADITRKVKRVVHFKFIFLLPSECCLSGFVNSLRGITCVSTTSCRATPAPRPLSVDHDGTAMASATFSSSRAVVTASGHEHALSRACSSRDRCTERISADDQRSDGQMTDVTRPRRTHGLVALWAEFQPQTACRRESWAGKPNPCGPCMVGRTKVCEEWKSLYL